MTLQEYKTKYNHIPWVVGNAKNILENGMLQFTDETACCWGN